LATKRSSPGRRPDARNGRKSERRHEMEALCPIRGESRTGALGEQRPPGVVRSPVVRGHRRRGHVPDDHTSTSRGISTWAFDRKAVPHGTAAEPRRLRSAWGASRESPACSTTRPTTREAQTLRVGSVRSLRGRRRITAAVDSAARAAAEAAYRQARWMAHPNHVREVASMLSRPRRRVGQQERCRCPPPRVSGIWRQWATSSRKSPRRWVPASGPRGCAASLRNRR